jgi:hypothetical protein
LWIGGSGWSEPGHRRWQLIIMDKEYCIPLFDGGRAGRSWWVDKWATTHP